MKELAWLASHLEELIRDAKERNLPLQKVPTWLQGWKSPWKGKSKGGELITKGEDELYDFGIRIRERFPNLFEEEYHPDVYLIKATQVSSILNYLFCSVLVTWHALLSDSRLSFYHRIYSLYQICLILEFRV